MNARRTHLDLYNMAKLYNVRLWKHGNYSAARYSTVQCFPEDLIIILTTHASLIISRISGIGAITSCNDNVHMSNFIVIHSRTVYEYALNLVQVTVGGGLDDNRGHKVAGERCQEEHGLENKSLNSCKQANNKILFIHLSFF